MKLSVVDDKENDYFLPGKPLSEAELTQLIEDSRKSGQIEMRNAHKVIRDRFDAD